MNWYIGLDIGTTNIKACAFCPNENARTHLVSIPTPKAYARDKDAAYEYDPEEIFEASVQVLERVAAQVTDGCIRAIALSSMAESGILLDADNRPLRNAITWFDPRSVPQADALAATLGKENLYNITGQICSSKFGITKLLWEKENNPQLYRMAKHWLSLNDYMLFRMSGRMVCDYSIAARTMAFDIHNLRWSDKLLDACGVPVEFFAEPLPGGTAIDTLMPELARRLGLSDKTLLVTGGHDHACAAVGSGTIISGTVLDSMGTSEVAMFPVARVSTSHEMYLSQASVYPHCSETLYRVLTSMQACGASINWFLDSIGKSLSNDVRDERISLHEHMNQVAASCEECPELVYYPFLRGTLLRPGAGGVFFGIHDWHDVPHFAKALLDGLCCEFTLQVRNVADTLAVPIQTVRAVGGPSRSSYFVQRKADISGWMVQVPIYQQAACFGAALLASVGCGDMSFAQIADIAAKEDNTTYNAQDKPLLQGVYRQYSANRKFIEECFS